MKNKLLKTNCEEFLFKLNEENYSNSIYTKTIEELKEKFEEYLQEYGREDEKEISEEDIFWEGEGYYTMVGYGIIEDYTITPSYKALEKELDYIECFPFDVTLDTIYDSEKYFKNFKKEKGYKKIYLISHINRVGIPKNRLAYVVYSNENIEDIIDYLHEEKNMFIGDCNISGANYSVKEVCDLDEDYFLRSEESEYEEIYLD